MAQEFKHDRHFQVATVAIGDDRATFTSVDDAKNKINFGSCYDAGSPTKTFALADSDKTLVVTYEFASKDDQDTFKTAVDNAWATGFPWICEDRDFISEGNKWKIKDGKPGAGTLIDLTDSGSESHTNEIGDTVTGRRARIKIARDTATGIKGQEAQDANEAFWVRKPIHFKTVWYGTDGTTVESTENLDITPYHQSS